MLIHWPEGYKNIDSNIRNHKNRPLKESQIDKQVKSPIVFITVFTLKNHRHFIDSNRKTYIKMYKSKRPKEHHAMEFDIEKKQMPH